MNSNFYKNNRFEVLTPDGFSDFKGVALMGEKELWRVRFEDESYLDCTYDHKLYDENYNVVVVNQVTAGSKLTTKNGPKLVASIELFSEKEPVYDLIEVEKGHRYYANDILSSNCQFVGSEETLLDQIMLSNMKGIDPITKSIKHVRWYKEIDPQMTYLVSLDPAVGTGGDNAAIQVLELPSLIQVAEWQHNKTPVEGQIGILKHITSELSKTGAEDIFWSVENNTLGEAALVVIRDVGEDNIPGMFLSDPDMRKTKGVRKGFSTSNRKKLEACIKFKRLIETNKLTILSKNLVSELKTFISSDGSYKAKSGCKDDLVTAMLMAIRMADLIAKWDPTLQEVLNSNIGQFDDEDEDDDYGDSPMPMAFL
jgi:hypothetical protein